MRTATTDRKPSRGSKQPSHVIVYLARLMQMLDVQQNRIQSRQMKRKGVSHETNV